ncbi:SpoIIAA-like anti-anti-sigma regulatory factor [Krasilnikovia cinnamomea]|uniref:Anti-sigma factor antagonist n=1 Tax=Krasilnikovia cinnamomea TaxID=349313 RepID=A0A4V2G5Y5_9ACTN|nr:STAS domain-containing protein [Krasilnikovia cinnamomea]RZU46606.1 SpoIIAA-like anti-anti-sigma regulatory factor [Krasilnikovia cinnamomea]
MTDLAISTQPDSDRTVRLIATGEIDMASAEQVTAAAGKALTTHTPAHLIIDLTAVTFLDSTGIAALLAARHLAEEQSCTLRVTGIHGIVERVLDVTGLLGVLDGPPPHC